MVTHAIRSLFGFTTLDLTEAPIADITPRKILGHVSEGARRIVMTNRQVTELRQSVMNDPELAPLSSISSVPPAGLHVPRGAVAEVDGAWIVERP